MEQDDGDVPETHVLAVASHVTSGYVGNTMATFCMQSLGCKVSAIHTVNYSNHVGYKRFEGRRSKPKEVAQLYQGLKNAGLDDFDVMLSGYCPTAALIAEVGKIARERKLQAATRPGSFFWVLDPVMGDHGRLYVAEETVPAYRALLKSADLILPNQFEAETLSGVQICDWASLSQAITRLHDQHRVPHVLITSVRLPPTSTDTSGSSDGAAAGGPMLSVVGSTATSDMKPRLFQITVPALPVVFSGTGDMFAAILVVRLRQAARMSGVIDRPSWQSDDNVSAPDLPLARATGKVLATMHAILKDTAEHYDREVRKWDEAVLLQQGAGNVAEEEREMQRHLHLTRAAEVRVVQNVKAMQHPPDVGSFAAQAVDVGAARLGGFTREG